MTQPRGLRNNNPGNLRQSGVRFKGEVVPSQDPAFKQFETIAWGYRAMFVVLNTYRKRGACTICDLLGRYAPPSENDTAAYIRTVSEASGIGPDTPVDTLNGGMMIPIVAAMSRVENARPAQLPDVEAGWRLFEKYRP